MVDRAAGWNGCVIKGIACAQSRVELALPVLSSSPIELERSFACGGTERAEKSEPRAPCY